MALKIDLKEKESTIQKKDIPFIHPSLAFLQSEQGWFSFSVKVKIHKINQKLPKT